MNKEIQEAIMYLEHTTIDDFNLENYQAENRIWAIKTLIEELQRKDNNWNELKKYVEEHNECWDLEPILDKIKEIEND